MVCWEVVSIMGGGKRTKRGKKGILRGRRGSCDFTEWLGKSSEKTSKQRSNSSEKESYGFLGGNHSNKCKDLDFASLLVFFFFNIAKVEIY